MSTQSAQLRTASQATVNLAATAADAPTAQGERQEGTSSTDKLASWALAVPAGILGWLAIDWVASILLH